MYSEEQIYEKITDIIVELFEVPKTQIRMESKIYEDLGLDSIDAIDLITELQTFVGGRRLKPEDFKSVRCVSDVVQVAGVILSEQQQVEI